MNNSNNISSDTLVYGITTIILLTAICLYTIILFFFIICHRFNCSGYAKLEESYNHEYYALPSEVSVTDQNVIPDILINESTEATQENHEETVDDSCTMLLNSNISSISENNDIYNSNSHLSDSYCINAIGERVNKTHPSRR